MGLKMKTAFICYMLSLLVLLVFGFSYLLRSEFMPYHSVTVGMQWGEVAPSFQVLILALMRVTGGLCLASGLSQFFLLIIPFRRGEAWARYLIPAVGVLSCASALNAMLYEAMNTPASPPIAPVLAALVLIVTGFIFSLFKTG